MMYVVRSVAHLRDRETDVSLPHYHQPPSLTPITPKQRKEKRKEKRKKKGQQQTPPNFGRSTGDDVIRTTMTSYQSTVHNLVVQQHACVRAGRLCTSVHGESALRAELSGLPDRCCPPRQHSSTRVLSHSTISHSVARTPAARECDCQDDKAERRACLLRSNASVRSHRSMR